MSIKAVDSNRPHIVIWKENGTQRDFTLSSHLNAEAYASALRSMSAWRGITAIKVKKVA